MTTILPVDSNGHPIPALRLKSGGAHSISTSATSARNTTAFAATTRILSLYATQDVYVNFGDSSVTASSSSHFFPAGVYYDFSLGGEGAGRFTHVAALRVSADGVLRISEKE